MTETRRLALMIDGDNAQPALMSQVMAELEPHGSITIRRVYGDWSKPHMAHWHDAVHTYALQPEHQLNYVKGKNATDMALIIDAMDILHANTVDGFCIVSSDSDYTPLVMRIRKENLYAIGIGKSTSAAAFVNACNLFLYTDELELPVQANMTAKPPAPPAASQVPAFKAAVDTAHFEAIFRSAYDMTAKDDDDWAQISMIGACLRQVDPTFEPRQYGHKLLSQVVQLYPELIKVKKVRTANGSETLYVRLKKRTAKTKVR